MSSFAFENPQGVLPSCCSSCSRNFPHIDLTQGRPKTLILPNPDYSPAGFPISTQYLVRYFPLMRCLQDVAVVEEVGEQALASSVSTLVSMWATPLNCRNLTCSSFGNDHVDSFLVRRFGEGQEAVNLEGCPC